MSKYILSFLLLTLLTWCSTEIWTSPEQNTVSSPKVNIVENNQNCNKWFYYDDTTNKCLSIIDKCWDGAIDYKLLDYWSICKCENGLTELNNNKCYTSYSKAKELMSGDDYWIWSNDETDVLNELKRLFPDSKELLTPKQIKEVFPYKWIDEQITCYWNKLVSIFDDQWEISKWTDTLFIKRIWNNDVDIVTSALLSDWIIEPINYTIIQDSITSISLMSKLEGYVDILNINKTSLEGIWTKNYVRDWLMKPYGFVESFKCIKVWNISSYVLTPQNKSSKLWITSMPTDWKQLQDTFYNDPNVPKEVKQKVSNFVTSGSITKDNFVKVVSEIYKPFYQEK